MSFRRFVFLVTDEIKSANCILRRFDVGRLFLSKRKRDRLADPPAMEQGQLPAAEIRFGRPPVSGLSIGIRALSFLLLGGSHGSRDEKVLSVDPMGRTLSYDTEKRTIRGFHSFASPKYSPVSLTDGKDLYVMDSCFTRPIDRDDCFEALIYNDDKDDWFPACSLPAPPYAHWFRNDHHRDPSHVISYAVVGEGLWFSRDSLGTHCFDLASGSWSKAGDWALPFYGRVDHVPDQGLWFGLTSRYEDKDSVTCATDLTVAPQTARVVWTDDLVPHPHWTSMSSHLVYLGRSRFCHARFFLIRTPGVGCSKVVVFTALEVERRGETADELAVVKHRSVQCNVDYSCMKYVF